MSEARPYTVGSTVKWREDFTEYAGVIASVRVAPELPGTASEAEGTSLESLEPVYVISLSDHSVVFRHHRDLVLV